MNFDEGSDIQILKDYEKLNIDIPTNRKIVREHYKEIIRAKMKKEEPLDEDEEAEKLMNEL